MYAALPPPLVLRLSLTPPPPPTPPTTCPTKQQIYVYRGAIQHHGIVVHVPAVQGGASAAAAVVAVVGARRPLSPHRVHVVHFDAPCDGVETTDLEDFLKAS